MGMPLVNIASVAATYCKDLNQLGRLLDAYDTAYRIEYHDPDLTEGTIKTIAKVIEPINYTGYRSTPPCRPLKYSVLEPSRISVEMGNHLHNLFKPLIKHDVWIKELLLIHPFKYGNYRLAWILMTWIKCQWNNPLPLSELI